MDPKDITSMGELSAEELEALTEAGEIKDADDDADELEAADDETDDDVDSTKADKAAADKAAADEVVAKADKVVEDDDDAPFVPDYGADPDRLKDINTRLEALNTEKEALRKKFADGDIDQDKYLEDSDKLSDERTDLTADKRVLEQAASQSMRHAEQLWESDQRRFWAKDENAIFARDIDPILFEALNAQVKILGQKDPGRSGIAVLREAAQTLREKFNLGGVETKPAPDAEKAKRLAAAARVKSQADKQAKTPQTLTEIPAAAEADEDLTKDEFANLDAMLGDGSRDPMEVEALVARMDAEAQRRFGTVRH